MNFEGDPILIVGGPTASGKSALALDLALRLRGVVINADSMQVYQELRILSARPTLADEERAPHRLYGTLPARERCSAGRWCDMALAEIADAQTKQLLPILVGGTGLYFRSLLKGLAPVPPVPKGLRDAAAKLHSEVGAAEFHRLLAVRDPDGAARIHPANTQRVLRAYEVFEATGKSLGEWQNEQAGEVGYAGKFAALVLEPPRELLYAACDIRSEFMAEAGGIEETAALLSLELDSELPIMKALGVREFAAFLSGDATRDEAVENLCRATRHYAKRQETWFRHQMAGAKRVSVRYAGAQDENIIEIAAALLSQTTSGRRSK
ncbi:MAG: tRNA (adenosine(37)-N6)-dimethylallyltransferase MiaA [Proteobacteria bacterium]|nr:tRNA (adenosine(37)-N6)-dimethylallyltransferase MiaA [Pseudomonadota bacterium]